MRSFDVVFVIPELASFELTVIGDAKTPIWRHTDVVKRYSGFGYVVPLLHPFDIIQAVCNSQTILEWVMYPYKLEIIMLYWISCFWVWIFLRRFPKWHPLSLTNVIPLTVRYEMAKNLSNLQGKGQKISLMQSYTFYSQMWYA